MNLVHVINSLHPSAGGPPVVALSQAAALAAKGNDVRVLTRVAGEETQALLAAIPGSERVRIEVLPQSLEHWRQAAELTSHLFRADYVHLHGVWEPLLWLCSRLCHARSVPYALTVHGMLSPWSLAQKATKKRVALALAYRRMLRQASALQCLNASELAEVQALGLAQRAVVVPNGVFLERLPRHKPNLVVPELVGKRYFAFLGRLHAKKRLEILIAALARLDGAFADVYLAVAGPDAGSEQPCRELAARLGVGARVVFLGPLYDERKYALLRGARAFGLPSKHEGFSVAIAESLAMELPVIISPEAAFNEVLEVNAGWIVPATADSFCQAMTDALSDPAEAKCKGQRGRALVEQRYQWAVIAEQLLAVYAAV